MKKMLKILNIIVIITVLSPAIVFASDAYDILANVLNAALGAISWIGYAVAIGALVFMGIKYVMSGAQEKANLKGKFTQYLIGIALIVFCSTIASAVANIASAGGGDAASIVDNALKLGGTTAQGGDDTPDQSDGSDEKNENGENTNTNIKYYPTSAAPKANDKLKNVLEKEGYYDGIETIGAPQFHSDGVTVKERTSFAKDGKAITEKYDKNGNLTSIEVKQNGKTVKEASIKYTEYDTISSIQITTKENDEKFLHTINSRKESGNVAMYSKQKVENLGLLKGIDYITVEMDVYTDKLPETRSEYDELPETSEPTVPDCKTTGLHVPDASRKKCIICGGDYKSQFQK